MEGGTEHPIHHTKDRQGLGARPNSPPRSDAHEVPVTVLCNHLEALLARFGRFERIPIGNIIRRKYVLYEKLIRILNPLEALVPCYKQPLFVGKIIHDKECLI